MKKLITIPVILICIYGYNPKLFAQSSTYTVTNNTVENYNVVLRIGEHPTECSKTPVLTRSMPLTLSPVGCGGEVKTASLGNDEWVYQVEIYEYNSCTTSCSGTGSINLVGVMQPCPTNPDSDSWNSCAADNAIANRRTYCNIND